MCFHVFHNMNKMKKFPLHLHFSLISDPHRRTDDKEQMLDLSIPNWSSILRCWALLSEHWWTGSFDFSVGCWWFVNNVSFLKGFWWRWVIEHLIASIVFYLYYSVQAYLSTNSNLLPKLNNSSQSWPLIEAPGTSVSHVSAAHNVSGLVSSWPDCQNLKCSAHFSICPSENQKWASIIAKSIWMLLWFTSEEIYIYIYTLI